MQPVRIGSRGSALAIAQATQVRDALAAAGRPSEIVVIETAGDRRAPDTAWGEGAFVAAIERALLDGRIDVAVHSAKDVPTDADPGLTLAAFLRRADPRDALVVRDGAAARRLTDLPIGTRVGTDSPRRTGFVLACRPDLLVHPLHGNVDTRLRRLDAGETDALVLACAGLDRLGLSHRIAERIAPDVVPPAPGQGAIAVQVRSDDPETAEIIGSIDHRPTRIAVEAERAFLMASGGGCRAPIGALATPSRNVVELLGGYARPDGSDVAFGRRTGPVDGLVPLGRQLALELGVAGRSMGGDEAIGPRRSRVIVTRATPQAADLLRALRAEGLEPCLVPAIEIEPASRPEMDAVARQLHTYRWVVVTSANGARAVLQAAERVSTALETSRFVAIGRATRNVLENEGIEVGFQPTEASSSVMAATLALELGDRVVVVRGDLAGDALAAALRSRGAVIDDVIAYRTHEAPDGSRRLLRAAVGAGPVDAIVHTSGSTVRGLRTIAEAEDIDVAGIPVICIGRETAEVATEAGYRVLAVAPTPDAAALARTTAAALTLQLQETS